METNDKRLHLEQPVINIPEGAGEELTDEELASMEYTGTDFDALFKELDSDRPAKADKIMIPELLDADKAYTGALYGYIREDSGYHMILGWDGHMTSDDMDAGLVGAICSDEADEQAWIARLREHGLSSALIGHRSEQSVSYRKIGLDFVGNTPLTSDVYLLRQNIFSRNSGLLETSWMDNKCVVISGCGSVGSCVALQLARSGVSRFVLIDTDCMEIHNVCRHQCSLKDVGRYKVDAVSERIRQINPSAEIKVFYQRIQDVPLSKYKDWLLENGTLFIGTCDNRVGNAYACDVAVAVGAPFVALGFMDRAWAGEIFVYLPQRGDICYRCAFNKQIEESIEEERRNHHYLDANNAENVHIVPGLDVDIEYGVCLLDKIALDVLNIGNRAYAHRLLLNIGQLTFFSGTADRSAAVNFWKHALPDPLSIQRAGLSEEMRRCDSCLLYRRRK